MDRNQASTLRENLRSRASIDHDCPVGSVHLESMGRFDSRDAARTRMGLALDVLQNPKGVTSYELYELWVCDRTRYYQEMDTRAMEFKEITPFKAKELELRPVPTPAESKPTGPDPVTVRVPTSRNQTTPHQNSGQL